MGKYYKFAVDNGKSFAVTKFVSVLPLFFFYFYFNVVVAFGCVRYLLSLLEWQRNKAQQQQNSRADKPSSTLCVKNYLENLGMFGGFNDAAGPSMCRGLAIAVMSCRWEG